MAASIGVALIPCLQSLNQIQDLVEQPGYRFEQDVSINSWTDELGRLRVWAANIGAHQTGQSSLEFRLRDASHISQQITSLLKDLEGVLNDVKDELNTERLDHAEAVVLSEDEEPCCEDEALTSELQQLHEEVVNIVDCLYKMSMLIRKPAQHDILLGSHRSDAAAFAPFDQDHVRNKFSAADETTIQRLGHAITQRRNHLRYRDRHRAKLGKGIEEVQGIGGIQRAATQTTLSETIATSFQNENIDFEELSSNSGVSQTSYSESLMGGGSTTIPPLPSESTAGKPFECPYCFFIIEVNGTFSWARHIFRDIKPYVCISTDCCTPNRLFDSRREWFSHVTINHDIEDLTCPLCRETLSSLKHYEHHLARHLEELALFALPRKEMVNEVDGGDLKVSVSTGEDHLERDQKASNMIEGLQSLSRSYMMEDREAGEEVCERTSYEQPRTALPAVSTSLRPARSDFTDDGSLAGLTRASSSGTPESVSSSQGQRNVERNARLLAPDSDGTLWTTRLPAFRDALLDPPVLQCPFACLKCTKQYAMENMDEWFEHSLSHFIRRVGRHTISTPPTSAACCFCEMVFENPDGLACWMKRMRHVAWHHHAGHSLAHARPDLKLFRFLWENRIIDDAEYRELSR